jgi:hypothetical protein
MGKVNIGLRGWRFDEDVVFDDEGRVRPLGVMDPDARDRILRLTERVGDPCDACWLIHGEENAEECNPAEVIYGEPQGEVVLCSDHERDFVYWFRNEADEDLVGHPELGDAFHEWFVDGGRAPGTFPPLDHVDESPDEVPDAGNLHDELPGLEQELREMDDEDLDALDVDLDDLDV